MIGVKTGTQTWSNSPQRSDVKSDSSNVVSATEREQLFQNSSLGDTLNKVADANWVDPSKKMRTTGNNQLNKDAFMNLLLTQMKNQDPTNPLKSHEMAAQLAQFTSLEKLTNIDSSIDGLRKDQTPGHNFQALNLIGKAVNTDNSKVTRSDMTQSHDLRFELAADAQTVDLNIKDVNGTIVRSLRYPNLKSGKNELNWNGQMEDGSAAPVGEYSVDILAVASNGKKVYAETKVAGTITGVNFTPQGPQLLVGKQIVNMSDVKSISDPNAAVTTAPQLGGKPIDIQALQNKPNKVAETKEADPKKARMAKGDLSEAAMTQEFINSLNKQGTKAGGMQGTGDGTKK